MLHVSKSHSHTCGRFGSPSGGALNSLALHFCFSCNVLMWHHVAIAEPRQLMMPAQPQTRHPSPPTPRSALFPTGPGCSGAGILMNTWRQSSADRQCSWLWRSGDGGDRVARGGVGQRPRVTPQLSNKSCSFKVVTPARHSVWLTDRTEHLAVQEKVSAEVSATTLCCNDSKIKLRLVPMQKGGQNSSSSSGCCYFVIIDYRRRNVNTSRNSWL